MVSVQNRSWMKLDDGLKLWLFPEYGSWYGIENDVLVYAPQSRSGVRPVRADVGEVALELLSQDWNDRMESVRKSIRRAEVRY